MLFFPLPTFTAIEIGFTRRRIYHNEESWLFETIINKSRESEQTFSLQIEVSTLLSGAGQSATPGEDFDTEGLVWQRRMTPPEDSIFLSYYIWNDLTPENQEAFQLSITPAISSPDFGCSITNGCYQQIEVVIIDDDGGL